MKKPPKFSHSFLLKMSMLTEYAFKEEQTQIMQMIGLYVNFWNANGLIISKWTNNQTLSAAERVTFCTYLQKVCDIWKLDTEEEPTSGAIDSYLTVLLSKGIDPLA